MRGRLPHPIRAYLFAVLLTTHPWHVCLGARLSAKRGYESKSEQMWVRLKEEALALSEPVLAVRGPTSLCLYAVARSDWPSWLLLCKSRLSTLVSDFVTVKLCSSISQKVVSSFSPSVVITATEHRRSYSIAWTPSLRNRCIVSTRASRATSTSFVPFCNIELSELECYECFCSALYLSLESWLCLSGARIYIK